MNGQLQTEVFYDSATQLMLRLIKIRECSVYDEATHFRDETPRSTQRSARSSFRANK